MNKNESKYFNTAILFDEALIHLLEKKDIEYITIKEICKKAGVNRSTFYLHYENINDLLEETINYINKKFDNYFDENLKEFTEKIETSSLQDLKLVEKKYLTPYLSFIKENQKIFRACFCNPNGMKVTTRYNSLKEYVLIPILDRFDANEFEKKYLLSFYINGIMAIVKEWIQDKCTDDINDIEEFIIKHVNEGSASWCIVHLRVVLLDTYANNYNSILNGYTGMGVSLVIIGLVLYIIITTKKDL